MTTNHYRVEILSEHLYEDHGWQGEDLATYSEPTLMHLHRQIHATESDPSFRCPECDTYSGRFFEEGDEMGHDICGRVGSLRSFIRGTVEYQRVYDHQEES